MRMQVRVTADTAGTEWIDLAKERNQVTSIVMKEAAWFERCKEEQHFVAQG